MTVYAWPSTIVPQTVQLRLLPAVRTFTSPYSRSTQAVDLMAEVWRLQMTLPPNADPAMGGQLEALFDRLKGPAHQMSLWHFARPAPLGTMRGSPTLAADAAQLASTINISGSGTLVAGDMLGVGGQLVRVMATPGSLSSVEIAPRLRVAMSAGTSIVWDKPTAPFMLMGDGAPIVWGPGGIYDGPDLEWMERL